jgi:hypothetical protein
MSLQTITPELPHRPLAYLDRVGTHITKSEWDEMPLTWKLMPETWLTAFDFDALMLEADARPLKPMLEIGSSGHGLTHVHEIVGLHSAAENFKTNLCLQLMQSLVTGRHFLGTYKPARKYRVFFLETEMSVGALSKRVATMFRGMKAPEGIFFASESDLRAFKRAFDLEAKFRHLKDLLRDTRVDVLIIDTANPFFRGKESPNDELNAGKFFDLLESMPAKLKIFVRHDHKPRELDTPNDPDPSMIRGSGQFADVPDLLLSIRRKDKRTHEASFYITKFRHGSKPDPLTVWFDAVDFRLIPYPPVIHVLHRNPLTRDELLIELKRRFNVGATKADTELIEGVRHYLTEYQNGHKKVFAINDLACKSAEWYSAYFNETNGL